MSRSFYIPDSHSHLVLFLLKKKNSFCHPFTFYFLQNQNKFGVFIVWTTLWSKTEGLSSQSTHIQPIIITVLPISILRAGAPEKPEN